MVMDLSCTQKHWPEAQGAQELLSGLGQREGRAGLPTKCCRGMNSCLLDTVVDQNCFVFFVHLMT